MDLYEKSHAFALAFVAINGVVALMLSITRTFLKIPFEEALIEVFMLEFFQVMIILLFIVLTSGYPKMPPPQVPSPE